MSYFANRYDIITRMMTEHRTIEDLEQSIDEQAAHHIAQRTILMLKSTNSRPEVAFE